ncbi:UDP-glucose 4-epimerase [Fusarium phyllophilum]|uniref:UDP-glucose 4-epimerase n=1 Tax=Fusarium phyllophilum TaxID=47803 RepID=A0A8H5NGM9_9HYPO|nr:UDP-glucose 4-epimerase [Fusarium phyllophilum]
MDPLVLSSGTTTPLTSTAQSLKSSSRPSTPAAEQDILFSRPPSPTRATLDEYVLVVGGLGYIGSHTTWKLLKDGSNVVVIDNLSNAFVNVLDTLNDMTDQRFSMSRCHPELQFYEADFRDDTKIQEILSRYSSPSGSQTKRVIHFAAYKSVSQSIEQPLKYYDNNVGGLIRLCNTLSNFNIKNLIFSSSATVYGSLADAGGRLVEESCAHTTTEWRDASGQEGQGFQTFNIGTGTGQTVYEVVEAMETASGRDIPVVKVGHRQGDVGVCVADPGRALTQLGWKPQKSLLDSCQDLCRFLEANGTKIQPQQTD